MPFVFQSTLYSDMEVTLERGEVVVRFKSSVEGAGHHSIRIPPRCATELCEKIQNILERESEDHEAPAN